MWKAKITEVSEVDQAGRVEIRFDILKSGNVFFPGIVITCDPGSYQQEIKRKALELYQANQVKNTIAVGTEISLP